MPTLRFFQYKCASSFGFSELRNIQLNHYDSSVHRGEQPRHTTKIQNIYPSFWRLNRRIAGGNAKSVKSLHDGLMSSMRGLQDGANRNKRVVFQKDDRDARQFLSTYKTYSGINAMTAKAALGNHSQKPHAQPLRLIPAQVPCKPSLSLPEIFESLEDLFTLSESLYALASSSKSASRKLRTLTTQLNQGVDSLRFRVFDALDAQGGVA